MGGQAAVTPKGRAKSTGKKGERQTATTGTAKTKVEAVSVEAQPDSSPEQTPRGWAVQTRTAFLEALADLGQVRAAARAAGVSPQSAYRLRRKSPTFAKAWQEAMDQALDALEETLFDRAINGIEKPVYYGGRSCGSVRHYSDALAMFLLRARRPETYGRALSPEPAAPGAGAADPVSLIEARLKALKTSDAAAKKPADGEA